LNGLKQVWINIPNIFRIYATKEPSFKNIERLLQTRGDMDLCIADSILKVDSNSLLGTSPGEQTESKVSVEIGNSLQSQSSFMGFSHKVFSVQETIYLTLHCG
jgi:hypothetical protein